MAITLVSSNVDGHGFSANGTTADLTGCETLQAAVAGQSIYIERLVVSSAAAISVTIGAGETASAVTTVIAGPLYLAANSSVEIVYTRPVKLASATALTADASGAGNVTIIAQGYIK